MKLSEDIRVMHAHDRSRETAKSIASTDIVKEQFVLGEHREIASRVKREQRVQPCDR